MIPPKRRLPLIAAILLTAHFFSATALAVTSVLLPDSVKPVEEAPAGGPIDPYKPLITRHALKAAEAAAPLQFEVALKTPHFSELQARVARGERISPQEMAASYEPSAADYDAVAAWLTSQGLTVTHRDPHRMAVFARGAVSQIQQALGVTFARVTLKGKEYTSAITPPVVPSTLSPLLVGINGLQPHIHPHPHIVRRQAQPNFSDAVGASYLPNQIAQAYSATALYNNDIQGSGQCIAIVIDTFPAPSDLIAFWQDAGVSQSISNIQFIQAVAGQLDEPSGEETLDTEWSSSMAPSAHVRVYAATDFSNSDLDQTYTQVIDDVMDQPGLGIHQMSMSYGYGEAYTPAAQVQADDQYFMKLTGLGVTVFAASGDDGSTPGPEGTGDESGKPNVDTPASDPYVAGVGGTTLILGSGNTVSSETVWNSGSGGGASGGGYSVDFTRPTWQTGAGVSGQNKRQVPDVSGPADPDYGAIIVEGGVTQTVGGTSWASPTWAGFCALLNQARANANQAPIGQLAPAIYPLLNSPDYPGAYHTDFRDIVSGNNATARSNGEYPATTGYDLCTGLGSPLVQPLALFLTASSSLVGVQNPAQVQSVAPGGTAIFTVAVSGASATYQWQVEPIGSSTWTNLADTGPFTGSATPTLVITGATIAMSGDQFQCIVTIGSNIVTTAPPSVLVVETPLSFTTLAGQVQVTGLADGKGNAAQFNYPSGVAVDSSGDIYVADYSNNQIREVTPAGAVSTPYGNRQGNSGSANGSGNNAMFNSPNDVAVDSSGDLYVADTGNNLIRKISGGVVSTLAGANGQFNSPEGIAVDSSSNAYVADTENNTIEEITPAGVVTTIAGQRGQAGYANGAATTQALFDAPTGVAVDSYGDVYVADMYNCAVREISNGVVTTVAGQPIQAGYLDGLAANSLFNAPIGLAIDSSNNLYIADAQVPAAGASAGNNVLRKLTPAGVVSTLAGDPGVSGAANGTGSGAQFYSPQSVAIAPSGAIYVADTYNQTIRASAAGGGGTAITKVISLSGTLSFGDVQVNDVGTGTFTINNSGNSGLDVSSISYPAGFSGNWSSGTVPAGGSQTITVTFAPLADTEYSGNIVVVSDATSGVNSIPDSGAGVTLPVEPTVTTGVSTGIGGTSVTLGGTVDPNGSATTVYFQYGTSANSLRSLSASLDAGIGNNNSAFSINLSGLAPNTLYYYQAVATNTAGTVYGAVQTFSTLPFTSSQIFTTGSSAAGLHGTLYSLFGNPAVNAAGYVAFQATLVGDGAIVFDTNNSGIWAQNSSGLPQLVARTGGAAPNTSGVFSKLSNPVYNDAEAVAFLGTLQVAPGVATASTDTGIWSNSSGLLTLVARQGDPAPGIGSGVTFKKFIALALPDQGGVLFLAGLSNGRRGIWAGNSLATLQLIVQEEGFFTQNNQIISTLAFLPILPYVQGQTRSFNQATGDIVCNATFKDKTSAIIEIAGTNSQLVVQSQGPAPDASGADSGAVFSAFGSPAINGTDNVAFQATLKRGFGGVTASSDSGIWADGTNGVLELVAQTGVTAPGAGTTFKTLGNPVYNDNGAVAFRATVDSAASSAAGIWSNSGGSLALVARQGRPAPGCGGATFKTFTALALPDQAGVILEATLNVDPAAGFHTSDTGIWAVDSAGALQLIVLSGSSVNGKTITGLSFLPMLSYVGGQTRNFTQSTGGLVYQATFSDKSTAIFSVNFP